MQRYSHYHAEDDLRAAVTTARRALRGAPERSVIAPVLWNTLGHTLLTRHDRRGRRRDLDAAIAAWTRAVELSPLQAVAPPSYLASLAGGLRERAARGRGDAATADLQAALRLHHEAVAALRESPELPGQLTNLGLTLHGLAVHTTEPRRYREASGVFARAVELGLRVSPGEALRAGRAWLSMAMDTTPDWVGAAAAGDRVLRALGTLLAVQLTRTDQESWLRTSIDVTATTALAHHKIGSAPAAVFVVESGRAVLLDTALTSIRRLSSIDPQLADRYTAAAEDLAAAIEATGPGRMMARP